MEGDGGKEGAVVEMMGGGRERVQGMVGVMFIVDVDSRKELQERDTR